MWLGRKSAAETALRRLEAKICFATRHREMEHAGRRAGFELESVVSCGGDGQRWRTKLDFRSRKSFDYHHWPTTFGTVPEIARARGVLIDLWLRHCAEQLKAQRQERGTSAVGQETEVAD